MCTVNMQVFLDKGTCQEKRTSVNEALTNTEIHRLCQKWNTRMS